MTDSTALTTIREALPTRPLDRNPAAVFLARLSLRSRRTQAGALATVAEILTGIRQDPLTVPWHDLRYEHTQAVRAALAERYAPATANTMLAALRGVLKEAWRLGLMDAEDMHRAVDLPAVRGETLPRGRGLSQGDFRALFDACAAVPGPSGVRDAALLSALYVGGVRRSEAVALDLDDYDPSTGALTIRHGKSNKARIVYLRNGGQTALNDWVEVRGSEPGALFFRIRRGGNIIPARMTDQAVLDILRRRAQEARIASCSPHDLRRSMISDLLDAGADISTVQKLAGHANVTTTQRYDRRGEETKKAAASLLHVPYRSRSA
jgi:integrase/recombinase XerD